MSRGPCLEIHHSCWYEITWCITSSSSSRLTSSLWSSSETFLSEISLNESYFCFPFSCWQAYVILFSRSAIRLRTCKFILTILSSIFSSLNSSRDICFCIIWRLFLSMPSSTSWASILPLVFFSKLSITSSCLDISSSLCSREPSSSADFSRSAKNFPNFSSVTCSKSICALSSFANCFSNESTFSTISLF